MKMPESLVAAVDCGAIQEVIRPLMSGKEAHVYVVVAAGVQCVAKVYKEASQRTFKHRSEYTEGRRTRNSRDQRAMSKRSRHGRSQDESGWRRTEVDTIQRLQDVGVRVPALINFVDDVVVMELVVDAEGNPAPRLGDLSFEEREAREIYQQLLREVTRMLSAGVIHGDLSEFNVLMSEHGPVLIDFPQSINAANSQSARKFLLRDVENLHRFADRHASGQPTLPYGEEIWSLYEAGRLEADSELRGDYRALEVEADTSEVLALIEDADREESDRRAARGEAPRTEGARPPHTVVDLTKEARPRWSGGKTASGGRKAGWKSPPSGAAQKPTFELAAVEADTGPKKRRSRRRRRRKRNAVPDGKGGGETSAPGSGRATASAQKKPVGSGDGETSKRRRRARSGVSRSVPAGARTGAPTDTERFAKPAADPATAPRSTEGIGAATRPARRRRKRRRSAESRNSS
jgi:RIO kinase 1